MRRQLMVVGIVLAGLALGVWALLQFGPATGPIQPGARAPEFRALDIATGDSVGLSDYRGKVTLVNIWATWCGPCREEMPSMQQAYAQLKDRGFEIAAVSIDESSIEDVRAFQREFGLTFDILHDRSGRIQQVYQTTGVPESFVVGRDGIIYKKRAGEEQWDAQSNVELIRGLLERDPSATDSR